MLCPSCLTLFLRLRGKPHRKSSARKQKGSEQTPHMNIVMWLDRLHPTQSKLIDQFIGIQVLVQTTNLEPFL